MVPVAGVPIWSINCACWRGSPSATCLLLTGYLGEQIESYFGNGGRLGLAYLAIRAKPQPLGTGGALREARRQLGRNIPAALWRFAAAHRICRRRPAA